MFAATRPMKPARNVKRQALAVPSIFGDASTFANCALTCIRARSYPSLLDKPSPMIDNTEILAVPPVIVNYKCLSGVLNFKRLLDNTNDERRTLPRQFPTLGAARTHPPRAGSRPHPLSPLQPAHGALLSGLGASLPALPPDAPPTRAWGGTCHRFPVIPRHQPPRRGRNPESGACRASVPLSPGAGH